MTMMTRALIQNTGPKITSSKFPVKREIEKMIAESAPPAKKAKRDEQPSTSRRLVEERPVEKAKTVSRSSIERVAQYSKDQQKVTPVPNLSPEKTVSYLVQPVIEKSTQVCEIPTKASEQVKQQSNIEKTTIVDLTLESPPKKSHLVEEESKIKPKKEDKPSQSIPVKTSTGKKQPYRLAKKELEKSADELWADIMAFRALPEEKKTTIQKKIHYKKIEKYVQRKYENRVEITRKG